MHLHQAERSPGKDDYDTASDLQLEMMKKAQALEKEYRVYALNILD